MNIYRIVKEAYATLDGKGGFYASGRWHSKGRPVVYGAESISLAAWEKFIHLSGVGNMPNDLVLMTIVVPDDREVRALQPDHLPKQWADFPYSSEAQALGNEFLRDTNQLLLKVPSAVIPSEYNYLINPMCPSLSSLTFTTVPFVFDKRLQLG